MNSGFIVMHSDWIDLVDGDWNIDLFSYTSGIVIPTDVHIFQRSSSHQPDQNGMVHYCFKHSDSSK